jgi:ABC-type nitrate/sulfonate/bicarbonate transport system permease component
MGHRRLTFTTGRSLHPPHDVIQVGFFQLDNLRDLLTALWLSTKVAFIGLAIAIALGAGREASPSGRTVGSAP